MPTIRLFLLITGNLRTFSVSMWCTAFAKIIVLPAAMDAFGHHVARLGAAGIETVAGKSFADDVAIGHHPDQLIVLADRNAADIVRSHQLCDFGDRRVWADPVDALVHRIFDFHGGSPLLRFQVVLT
jgi:hypothetical protein